MKTHARSFPAVLLALGIAALGVAGDGFAQNPPEPGASAEASVPETVDVDPSASDRQIEDRLARILDSTGWFEDATVRVKEGIVFLEGRARSETRKSWAGDLARQTESVVAVVNRIEVIAESPWDPVVLERELGNVLERSLRALPLVAFAALVFLLSWLGARLAGGLVRRLLRQRIGTVLLLDLIARLAGLVVFLAGFYLVLRVSGLTHLAMTLVGGTGIAALVVGVAFRDILENFLASLLISLRRPFAVGDVVEIDSHVGVIQKVTTRGTLLMSFEGNHVQIPNATVYKSQIVNYTANPKRRMEFGVGIGYDDELAAAQKVALDTMKQHPAVLATPEPLVLADALAASTVNLMLYFWYDGTEFDGRKIRSALIRRVKQAFEEAGFSMPDEAREVIFPNGVPIQRDGAPPPRPVRAPRSEVAEEDATEAEGGLDSEHREIQAQADASRSPEEGDDLLSDETAAKASD